MNNKCDTCDIIFNNSRPTLNHGVYRKLVLMCDRCDTIKNFHVTSMLIEIMLHVMLVISILSKFRSRSDKCHSFLLLFHINYLVFKRLVQSGFSAQFEWTTTATGCLIWQDPKKPDQTGPDRFFCSSGIIYKKSD